MLPNDIEACASSHHWSRESSGRMANVAAPELAANDCRVNSVDLTMKNSDAPA